MNNLYTFLSGPALWAAFIIFIGGLGLRVAFLFGLSLERDRVFYNHADAGWGFRSILHWLIPLGSVSLREQPFFAVAFYVFHVCLLAVPLFLLAHNILWREAFGISLPSMADSVSDILTIVFIIAALVLLLRRFMRPEVRILTSAWDYVLLLLSALPFVTGFLAYHQVGPYRVMMIAHILSAEVLLVVIPFSKLAHMVLFFFSRAFIGFEMGQRRGARTW
ncbi:MAG: respiratory nitrate reductase subunit gamma [Desulfobacteraceae bacterium]|nr:respiratory nitrate reductase subunit gamma [Desulfobacteraceae bacterium]